MFINVDILFTLVNDPRKKNFAAKFEAYSAGAAQMTFVPLPWTL